MARRTNRDGSSSFVARGLLRSAGQASGQYLHRSHRTRRLFGLIVKRAAFALLPPSNNEWWSSEACQDHDDRQVSSNKVVVQEHLNCTRSRKESKPRRRVL